MALIAFVLLFAAQNGRLFLTQFEPHFGHGASCLYTLGFAIAPLAFQRFRSGIEQIYISALQDKNTHFPQY